MITYWASKLNIQRLVTLTELMWPIMGFDFDCIIKPTAPKIMTMTWIWPKMEFWPWPNYIYCKWGQHSSLISHRLLVPGDHNSNLGGGDNFSSFILELWSHDWHLRCYAEHSLFDLDILPDQGIWLVGIILGHYQSRMKVARHHFKLK